ncbi:hypothetical protein EJ05DRAFT_176875 [Pseudovirgaria hyperparasitica]|uniref:Zn(2)-C6 fungal-type domain-containing protein n=1 Tax=Pseudovirgaria hyperparasitica TaxID=470096 RepID=A0A6A6WHL9_9PEZI|nr:uncharacterized protein EJ05DRAFT_176875 [Pseudovirgaria hyperparasitica]KAF2761570.1 hypothetical protein EJ05DRAFT_176875 [Pseudovirgaria hyperparasitica]
MFDPPVFEHTTAPSPPPPANGTTQRREISFIFPSPVKDGQPRSRKLRASCDSCSLAKVRCSKEHPICQRCKNIGHKCNYSPSMRLGKPRSIHKKPKPEKHPQKPLLTPMESKLEPVTSTSKPMTDISDANLYNLNAQNTAFDTLLGLDGPLLPESDPNHLSNIMDDTIYFPTNELFTRQPSLSTFSDSSIDDYLSGNSMDFAPDFAFDSPEPINAVPGLTSDSEDDITNCFIDPKSTQNVGFSTNPLQTPEPSTPGSPAQKAHDCTEIAFKALNSLYSCESAHSKPGSFPDNFTAMENIISENDRAMEIVERLMACPCSISPNYSTTLCFILLKVLSLCNIAQGLGGEIQYPGIFTPRQSLPGEDGERRVKQAQSIITGLRRVEKVVDEFSSRFSRNTDNGKIIDEMVYVHQERMLRKMLRKAAGSAMIGMGSPEF